MTSSKDGKHIWTLVMERYTQAGFTEPDYHPDTYVVLSTDPNAWPQGIPYPVTRSVAATAVESLLKAREAFWIIVKHGDEYASWLLDVFGGGYNGVNTKLVID